MADKPRMIPVNTFDAAMKHVQKKGTYTPKMLKDKPVKNWINDTYNVLKKGVDAGIANNVVPDEMAAHLDHDTFLFSGFKVHAALEQAKLRLRNNDGSIKSFEKFRQDVDVIDARYNRQYLQAEYQFAISSSQSAANWTQVAEDGDTYNLQYRTAGDEAVRESHRALNGITLPSSDPFWDKFYPPNGWRCRCDAVQVRKSKHPVTDSNKAQKAGAKATTQINRKGQNKLAIFRFNPGKEQKIFPPKHPYLPKGCEGCTKGSNLSYDPKKGMCQACLELAKLQPRRKMAPEAKDKIYALPLKQQYDVIYTHPDSKFSVFQHKLVDNSGKDYNQVLAAAKAYAKETNCKINPEVEKRATNARKKIYPGLNNNSNPDLTTDKYGYIDVKSPLNKNNIVRNANNACKQGGIAVITDSEISGGLTMKEIEKFTGRLFSNKNIDKNGVPNYIQDEIHWLIGDKILKCNRPKQK